jgi:DNA repair ATPase RecN
MSENVQSAMYEILKKIQAQLSEHDRRFDAVDKRFDELGALVRKPRRDTAGLLVMAKSITGNFAEELAAVEERVRALEAGGR